MMKKSPKLIFKILLFTAALIPVTYMFIFLGYHFLPFQITRLSEMSRGKELITNIDNHLKQKGALPDSMDWKAQKSLGFSLEEMEVLILNIKK